MVSMPTAPTCYGLVNESTSIKDADVETMAMALELQLQRDFCPAYNLPVLPVKAYGPNDLLPDGAWYLHFVDNVADPDALGYHTDEDGLIFGNIEIAVLLKYGCGVLSTPHGQGGPDSVSSVVSHELMEMAVDPQVNLWSPTVAPIDGTSQATEVCDPCQEDYYMINGVQVSDFVLPAYWLKDAPAGSRFDHLNVLSAPFTIAPGGYAVVQDSSGASKQVYGARPPSALRQVMNRRKKMRLQPKK